MYGLLTRKGMTDVSTISESSVSTAGHMRLRTVIPPSSQNVQVVQLSAQMSSGRSS